MGLWGDSQGCVGGGGHAGLKGLGMTEAGALILYYSGRSGGGAMVGGVTRLVTLDFMAPKVGGKWFKARPCL
jgi:hypothetical protein